MKFERRELIAAGGLAAFAAGFSQTLGRMVSNFTGEKEARFAEGRHIHGRSAEPEFTVDPVTGEFTPNPKQQVSYTACLGCTTQCGVRVRIDKTSGQVIRVVGNPYSPLSTEPHLPMKMSVKESLVAMSRFQDKGLAGRSTARDARPFEFAFGQGTDVLQLPAQIPPPAGGIAGRRGLLGELSQGGQRRFQRMGKIAQGMAGTALALVQQVEQAVEFGDQRPHLGGRFQRQLWNFPARQPGQLASDLLQWRQAAPHD